MATIAQTPPRSYRILSLDGGGAKGFYTIGVLKELEASIGQPLHEQFSLIFGTSTGAIIAALLALGKSVNEIHDLYKRYVPEIMEPRSAAKKSAALDRLTTDVFGKTTFVDVKTGIGIVATHWVQEKPMIFKGDVAQAHGRQGTFEPGFGCTIADAVRASCSAYPFFLRPRLNTNKGEIELMDGGYCANNPTLYAIADAVAALQLRLDSIRVVSVGVGVYPEPRYWGRAWFVRRLRSVQLLQKTLNVNTFSMEQLRAVLFKDVWTVRINDTFERPEMATDLMEHDMAKLNMLFQRGSESFAKHEDELKQLLDIAGNREGA